MNYGKFVISLDFELFWGVRDSRTISSYGSNITKWTSLVKAKLYQPGFIALSWSLRKGWGKCRS